MFIILWQTRKIKSFFKLKDSNKHPSSVVHKAECSCWNTYNDFVARKAEHDNPLHNSQPARHLASHPSHSYTWNILHKEKSLFKGKTIEGLLIAREQPSLNKQMQCCIRASQYSSAITYIVVRSYWRWLLVENILFFSQYQSIILSLFLIYLIKKHNYVNKTLLTSKMHCSISSLLGFILVFHKIQT